MSRRTQSISFVLFLGVLSLGCRSSDDGGNGGGDGGPTDGGGGVGEQRIQDVQDDRLPVGSQVVVNGVIVSAIDRFGSRQQTVYVQEPSGGARSGVGIFIQNIPAELAVGDVVDVRGTKDEFALDADDSGETVTQIENATITVTGSGDAPEPEVLNPWDLADPLVAEEWEGVLVRFADVKVERRPDYDEEGEDQEMTVTGPFRVRAEQVMFPANVQFQDCYTQVTGVVDYFFNYRLIPRSSADLAAGGSNCLPEEDGAENAAVCADGLDNDRDGFDDCEDFFCYGIGECGVESDVISVQNDSVALNTLVIVEGTVTAVNRNRTGLWIMNDGVAAQDHNGVEAIQFGNLGELDPLIARGRSVTVTGVVRDSFGATRISNARVDDNGDAGNILVRSDVAASLISDPTTGKVLEGQLVSLENLQVVSNTLGFGQFSVATGGSNDLVIDDTLFTYELPDEGSCVTDLVGVVLLNTFDDYYYVAPRDGDDLNIVAGACD